jgi:hypothetical protein
MFNFTSRFKTKKKFKSTDNNLNYNSKTIRSKKCFAGTDGSSVSCYSTSLLKTIANDWNKYTVLENKNTPQINDDTSQINDEHKTIYDEQYATGGQKTKTDHASKLNSKMIKNVNKKSKGQLWNELDKTIKKYYGCTSEICWTTLPFISQRKSLLKQFRPIQPKDWKDNKTKWLTTTDIENVLYQYEKKHEDFKFLGVSSVDYDYKFSDNVCVSQEICKLNLKKLYNKGIRKIGIVFNLDKHDESGSHWVALYSDFNKREVYYFDSYGIKPPFDIRKLMKNITQQGKYLPQNADAKPSIKGQCMDNCELEPSLFTSYYNDYRNQYKNSECGVYSMHFIISFLEGNTFNEIVENVVSDDEINKLRDVYYSKLQ